MPWSKDSKVVIRISKSTKNPSGVFWPLYCLFFVDLLILNIPLVSFDHCIVCSSSIYWIWLPLWNLLTKALWVLRRFTNSNYPFGIFWPLYCLFFVKGAIRISKSMKNRQYNGQKIPKGHSESVNRWRTDNTMIYWFWLHLWYLLAIVLSVLHRFADSDCLFDIFWPLHCLFFVDLLAFRISKSMKNRQYNGQKITKG
jgi:predicted nucleic acid-binding Zn ribbon protein